MKKLFGGLGLGLLLSSWLVAGDLYMAGGAGYKRPLEAIAKAFEAKSSHQVKMMFGNMQQVSAQIKESDKISLFFGDEKFIQKLGIPHEEKVELGAGKLMLVFSKDSKAALEMASLATPLVKSVGIPDTKSAIYGIAGEEALRHSGVWEKMNDKLKVLQTVPQVSAYLVSGDLDAGLINKTDYIGIKEKVGQALEVDSKLYSPIKIIGVVLKGKEGEAEVRAMLEFLKSPEAREILRAHGL